MKITVERGAFLKALSHVQSVVERRNTIPILSNVMIEAAKGSLKLTATDLDIEIVETLSADVLRNGAATAPAHMLYDIVRKLPEGAQVQAELLTSEGGRLAISSGSVRFELACLPKEDFPQMAAGALPHKFRLGAEDLKRLIDKTRFAISTEETRFYLNGIYLHATKDGKARTLRAVATDGHRLARFELELPDGASDMPGIIVPRKTVAELRRLLDDTEDAIDISLSDTKIQFVSGGVELTSKLIDGTFPDYQRVIPTNNDKSLSLDAKEFSQSVDRVSTISADKTRAVKLNIAKDKVTLSVVNPDSGTATEELGATYAATPIEIGFNARYLLDITGQIEGKEVRFLLHDAGSPTLIEDADDNRTLYVAHADAGVSLIERAHPSFEAPLREAPEDDAQGRHAEVRGDGRTTKQAALAVTQLRLSNFRSYTWANVDIGARPVVLAGANGAGKTNLLEAISLLAPGRGLRGASLSEHTRKGPASAESLWSVAATVRRGGQTYDVGTGLTAGASGATRQVCLNGAPAQSSADLGELIQMVWLTPAMDRLFLESASGRRRFLDRLTLSFAPSHAKASLRYEQAMRERGRLLKYGPRDPVWLSALEEQMAENGITIALTRSAIVDRLNRALSERREAGAFPSAQLSLVGEADAMVAGQGENATAAFRERLACMRVRDAESGRTGFGPHVSDLLVRHTAKRADARECSTGEQKALLISIVLAHARDYSHIEDGLPPILLLDEIVAHLDVVRRAALFEEILALGAQAWMTGTELSMFTALSGHADIFEVAESRLTRISE